MTRKATRKDAWFGWLFVLAGVGCMWMIATHPERLNAPAWVAYLACMTFVFGGLAVVFQAYGKPQYGGVLAWLIVTSFAVIGLWIGLGPGERACTGSISIPGLSRSDSMSGLGCRIPFGAGGALCALIALWMMVSGWRHLQGRR